MRTEVVAVSIVALLITGILFPLILQSRTQSRQETVKDRLRTIGSQFQVYHDTFQSLPTGQVPRKPPNDASRETQNELPVKTKDRR